MGLLPVLVAFSAGTLIKAADFNTNFSAIKTAFDNTAVLTDVARTISVAHTFAADILFTDALYDIGKTGATRPRDGFFSRNVTVGAILLFGSAISTGASSGEGVLANSLSLRGVNAAGTATKKLVQVNAADRVEVGEDGSSVYFPCGLSVGGALFVGTTVTTNSLGGEMTFKNGRGVRGVVAANNDTKAILRLNASDRVELSPDGLDIQWGNAAQGNGTGATITLGAAKGGGANGPTGTAQVGWLKFYTNGGVASYLPYWQ